MQHMYAVTLKYDCPHITDTLCQEEDEDLSTLDQITSKPPV